MYITKKSALVIFLWIIRLPRTIHGLTHLFPLTHEACPGLRWASRTVQSLHEYLLVLITWLYVTSFPHLFLLKITFWLQLVILLCSINRRICFQSTQTLLKIKLQLNWVSILCIFWRCLEKQVLLHFKQDCCLRGSIAAMKHQDQNARWGG